MEKIELKPASVFEHFAQINKIPRPSKHEEKMIEYLKNFGESRNLETIVDETGNVVIRKKASKGYENKKTLILQSHMDMVCEKLVDKEINFEEDPIETYVDGEWLKAKGTTLGADDGIGCAMQLAVLDDDSLEHGPIECVFTRDEETGLTGASGMKEGFMTGDMLINLDSEDEGQFFISCAGGMTTVATFNIEREEAPENYFFLKLSLQGLHGGHSGDDINKKFANGIKLLTRFIYIINEKYGVKLVSFNSGRMHNAIPRDGVVIFAVPAQYKENVSVDLNVFTAEVEAEFHVTEKEIKFSLESTDKGLVIKEPVNTKFIQALQAVDNGVMAMCQDEALAWMVETSSNVASVNTTERDIKIVASQRSNVMSNLNNMGNTIKALFELAGAEVTQGDKYPAWQMKQDSKLTQIVVDTYKKLFNKEPLVIGIHAGLECGLFSEKYPHLDMVSMGPTLRGVHSPEERLLIPTVQMVWDHLLEIMKNVPEK
ncbi:aminoacyl-histidine dipeptidase [uncultured Prevotella sp.]|uniref:aminoacyl-histidine dipeptidase n=1 Tax=Xylanibacter rarus TaxID=1676614 RepID=UPI00265CCAF7|nr:aminoacyl-histidine dipeptidase [uncultured Prevotella sp.]